MLYESGEEASATTFVRIYGFGLPTTSRYPDTLLSAIAQASVFEEDWFAKGHLPPALRKQSILAPEREKTQQIIADAVFTGILWFDSQPNETREIYQTAIQDLIFNVNAPERVNAYIASQLRSILR